jgi:hypothetical protein
MKNSSISLILVLAISSLASCSKSTPPVSPEKPIVTVPVVPPPPVTPPSTVPPTTPPTSTVKLLPIKIESITQSTIFKYVGETNALLTMETSAGKKTVITYKDQQMIGMVTLEGDKVFSSDYYRDDQQRINKVIHWSQTDFEDINLGYYTIDYDQQQQITELNYYSPANRLLRTRTFAYDQSNDQIGIVIETDGTATIRYTFDRKNGLFKNVAHAQLIGLETGEKLFLSAEHNLLSSAGTTAQNDLNCSYEYNTDAYPSLINWKDAHVNITFKVSYKTP